MSTLEEDEKAVDAYNGYVKVIIAFNHFGEQLLQRMAECRRACTHVINDVYLQWEMYAIRESGNPTINNPGDQRPTPVNPIAKEEASEERKEMVLPVSWVLA
uniref:Probable pectate lyase 12 n=1 Tax=Tanacetum cinerariifolium TaxID=118510 RepID=A0A6L2NNS0_TANCI|nr:probable pectate lyase 12 [Tanacetum cinerariifolium]